MGRSVDRIDRDELHEYLWKTRDRTNKMAFKPGELAADLQIALATVSIILRELVDDGKLRKISAHSKYEVIDPKLTAWKKTEQKSIFE